MCWLCLFCLQADLQAISRAHRLGQQKTVLVLRLVSLGPEVQGPSLIGTKGNVRGVGEVQRVEGLDGAIDEKINGCHDKSYTHHHDNIENVSKKSNTDSYDDNADDNIDDNDKRNIDKRMSLSKGRILSVEQQMLRTAAQKLFTEKLVLAQGMFDMGTSVGKNVLQDTNISQDTMCDTFVPYSVSNNTVTKMEEKERGKEKDKDKDTIASLFAENETGNEDEEEYAPMESSPSTFKENSSRIFSMSLNSSENEDYFLWLKTICDRGDIEQSSLIPTLPSSSSSSSTSLPFSSSISTSTSLPSFSSSSTSISLPSSTAKSYPISHGVFRSDLMKLYNTPEEIMDWCTWLKAVAVSPSDRNDLQTFEECSSSNLSYSSSSALSYNSNTFNNSSSSSSSNNNNNNSSSSSDNNNNMSSSSDIISGSGGSSSRMATSRKRANGSLSENSMWFKVRTCVQQILLLSVLRYNLIMN